MINFVDIYTSVVCQDNRAKLGHVFTNRKVAEFMVKWVILGNDRACSDPLPGCIL